MLDAETCYRALLSRDARFDGRFFAAVRTTGIYCRPVCPARKPLRANVTFFPNAAAAEEAGFRPCRRCRPERAPEAFEGGSALVARALRRIHAGALDEDGVEGLAAGLGVGARHLTRLFRDELGASPGAVGRTLRAHLARRLIDESDLPMTDVAGMAGFRSVRRFNAVVRESFGATPSELRRRRRRTDEGRAAPVELRLPYRAPYDLEGVFAFLARRAVAGLETVAGRAYRRTVLHEGRAGWIELRPASGRDAMLFATNLPPTRGVVGLVERAKRLLDLRSDPRAVGDVLAADPRLARELLRTPGVRVPGAWDGFEIAVRAVLGQQVSLRGACTLVGRLVTLAGRPVEARAGDDLTHAFPTPEEVLRADADGALGALGVPGRRRQALVALARAVADGELDLDPGADPDAVRRRLVALPGVGPWTAEYVAMRALADPDAFPGGDLVLRRAAAGEGRTPSAGDLIRRAEAWRPWRAYAAVLLWSAAGREARREDVA